MVRIEGRFQTVADLWREPLGAVAGAFAPVGTLGDKLKVLDLRRRALAMSLREIFEAPEQSIAAELTALGFTPTIVDRFFRPFLGGIFLLVQGSEWVRLIHYGLTGVYGGTFYTLIGCHGLHVIGALVAVLVVRRAAGQGHYTARQHAAVTACQLFWFFVVGVWPVLYVLVYLT